MRNFVLKKVFHALLTIAAVLVFNYFLFRIMPGDPLQAVMRNPKATPEAVEKLRLLYGLNEPWYTQFGIYLRNLFRMDLGLSFLYKRPVFEVITSRLLPTVLMVGLAEIIAITTGVFVGIVSAARRGKPVDVASLSFSLVTYAMPTFWLGIILVSVFSVSLRLLPTTGMLTPGLDYASLWAMLSDGIRHLILPTLTMSLVLMGEYAILMRNALIDVLTEDYITTAYAKGFKEDYVIKKHAIPNAMLPMITIIAMNLGFVIGGAIQVETIFSWPGLGRLMYDALVARDYPLLQGIFLLITVCVILANFLADLTYGYLDPRVKQ